MTLLHVLRVFTDEAGGFGNPLGVVLDGAAVPAGRRQGLAAALGFSETVFVDDTATGEVAIFTPASELPLAGHPLVGTGWLLHREFGDAAPSELLPPAGPVPTWVDTDGSTWIRGPLSAAPPWTLTELPDADVVAGLSGPPDPAQDAHQFWAWLDETAGLVRARVFAARYDVHEDEACGSASMLLADRLRRDLTIHHGEGSVVHARPAGEGFAEVGGRVVLAETRTL